MKIILKDIINVAKVITYPKYYNDFAGDNYYLDKYKYIYLILNYLLLSDYILITLKMN